METDMWGILFKLDFSDITEVYEQGGRTLKQNLKTTEPWKHCLGSSGHTSFHGLY